ncbi:hypothetical protein PAXRUDRAFT_159520 [Paxillus rubicundulus Ve08.2h10]|uniref:Uncharacterized protein n=1 Tax=Paxillus rubicundulus Ve08.2h10 TaxID=930991 RepID=A0A0D0DG20_9AGAM|nr:hypothetical protein PAXRUDRAFT_159520 [Paxillus rubicundulus Ve08.2h10]
MFSREKDLGAHPFWYAQVLHTLQVPVHYTGSHLRDSSPHLMEVLWVHWLGVEPGYHWGSKYAQLPKVIYVPDIDEHAFGFLDPSLVIRACHLIPLYADRHTGSLMRAGPSLDQLSGELDDWWLFYVNMYIFTIPSWMMTVTDNPYLSFADRDMYA